MTTSPFAMPSSLLLGREFNDRVARDEQLRQRREVEEILRRFRHQPGLVLADEVGMGKTFVALGVAYAVARSSPVGPVIVMAPPALITKWEKDLRAFVTLYAPSTRVVHRDESSEGVQRDTEVLRYGVARHSIELMRLLDDPKRERCDIIFLAQGAMSRRQADKWVRIALIAEALRRHARGRADRLIKVKQQIHRFLARLISAVGEQRTHGLGDDLWRRLLAVHPMQWRELVNSSYEEGDERLRDDPVPTAVLRALQRDVDLRPLAASLEGMPVRAVGSEDRVKERILAVRASLAEAEQSLWSDLLAKARWRSPLLILDEAHHLKNADTRLARQFQDGSGAGTQRTGDGALARSFDRMLFLTATPFQLGHHELVNVMHRFADVRPNQPELAPAAELREAFTRMLHALTETQRATMLFQSAWQRVSISEDTDVRSWWMQQRAQARADLPPAARAVVDAYDRALVAKRESERLLRPWVIRHNKGRTWAGSAVERRQRNEGAAMVDGESGRGLTVPSEQLLPFYLAARSATNPSKDLLGEALSSSYEAFRHTRARGAAAKDHELDVDEPAPVGQARPANWYLEAFDQALARSTGRQHPKVAATVARVVRLWEAGEKVVVFAFYRHTCRALRIHISDAIEHQLVRSAEQRLGAALGDDEVSRLVERVQERFFDKPTSPGRRAFDAALHEMIDGVASRLDRQSRADELRDDLTDVMRRFLRAKPSLARSFPLDRANDRDYASVAAAMLTYRDSSGVTWRDKFSSFLEFLLGDCTDAEQREFLDVLGDVKVGSIRVDSEDTDAGSRETLPNIQSATGDTKRETRERLMRAFNTPFFPEILVCSQVMGEGVDLQRYCRHVVHHDLDWNPSTLEQRTGRIDRLACKAEKLERAIVADLPYVAGASDERQFKVMSERERWFRVVMGQDVVNQLIATDAEIAVPLPDELAQELSFDLSLR